MKKIIVLFTFLFALFFSGFLSASAAETPAVVSALRWTARNDGDPPFCQDSHGFVQSRQSGGCH